MIDILTYSFFFAAFAVIYTEVLTAPGMILGWFDALLHRHIQKEWLLHPLGDCQFCFGGQVALWGYLFTGAYSLREHIAVIVVTIFFIHIYQKWN